MCFQWTFCIACIVVLGACAWFYVQTISGRDGVYAAAFVMGCGNSVMLVTVLSMTADMIGIDKVRHNDNALDALQGIRIIPAFAFLFCATFMVH